MYVCILYTFIRLYIQFTNKTRINFPILTRFVKSFNFHWTVMQDIRWLVLPSCHHITTFSIQQLLAPRAVGVLIIRPIKL